MVLSDSGGQDLGWKKYLIAGWAFSECLLFAGLIYGWGSLVFVFKDEGIYADACEKSFSVVAGSDNSTNVNLTNLTINYHFNDNDSNNSTIFRNGFAKNGTLANDTGDTRSGMAGNCVEQESNFALCFTVASSIFCASCFSTGHINFKFGTRVTRLLAFPAFLIGCLCLAFVSKDVPWLMYPGLCFIGIGGVPLLVTNTQVSKLFTKGSSSVVGLLCGGYDMSSAVILVTKLAHQAGFRRRDFFLTVAGLHCMTLISTFLFLPKKFIADRTTGGQRSGQELEPVTDSKVTKSLLGKSANRRLSLADEQPLRGYIRQPLFITHVIWLCFLHLRYFYFLGGLNKFLNDTLKGDQDLVSHYTDVCFYMMMAGIATSFLTGIVYDWVKRVCSGGRCKMYRDVMPAVVPQSIASLSAVIMSVLILVPTSAALYAIFIVMTLCRSFLYSMAAAFISSVFPNQYFAVLYGLCILLAGVFGFLQYVFFTWAEAYQLGAFHGDILFLVMSVLSFGHPVYMTLKCLQEERSSKTKSPEVS